MIKEHLSESVIAEIMHALKESHGGKEIIFIDMDVVVADFESNATEVAAEMGLTFQEFADQKQYRHIPGFYLDLPLMLGAKEAIEKIDASGKYDLYFLSAPSWGNVSCFSDKRVWVDRYFPSFRKKLGLSFQKGHHLGHYLIDDRTKYGAGEFIGEHIQFGTGIYPDWDSICKKLL